ncbi:2'-5' RNA ligase family protein [Phycicoccus avicenniae]|uniref:2'-5' RNA ligase family protein n=1 Tax=Phycicoccus avicenniae TaxID=2828860 RepID=UPI003D26B62E
MILFLALVPPPGVADALAEVVSRVPYGPDEFHGLHRSELLLRVAGLGSMATPEVASVVRAVRDGLPRGMAPPHVWLDGAWALESEKDPSIGARVAGDVDALNTLVRTLPTAVQAHGLYLDRRAFLPRLSVGTITANTGLGFIERLVGELAGFRTEPWDITSVEVVRRRFAGENVRGFEVVESVPLRP